MEKHKISNERLLELQQWVCKELPKTAGTIDVTISSLELCAILELAAKGHLAAELIKALEALTSE